MNKEIIIYGGELLMGEISFCCETLREMYEIFDHDHKVLVYTTKFDETQWYINGLAHLYFCPFCGSYIAGRGFGKKIEPNKRG